jgi:hypothetical protein
MTVKFILGQKSFFGNAISVRQSCDRFTDSPCPSPYRVSSCVSGRVFQEFLAAIEGGDLEVTEANASALSDLCAEFSSPLLSAKLAAFESSAEHRLTALEAAVSSQGAAVSSLDRRIAALEAAFERLAGPFAAQGQAQSGMTSETALLHSAVAAPQGRAVLSVDSRILTEIPAIFDGIRGRFSLLWRGSRDGFGARAFHRRCDGHAGTLVVIRDSGGSVFGGFTPVAWETRVWNGISSVGNNCFKEDPTLKSFVFSLRNPSNTPPMAFQLKRQYSFRAICCGADCGPVFGYSKPDLRFYAPEGSPPVCYTKGLGTTYDFSPAATSGVDPCLFLTGAMQSTPDEIEVFEITE